MTRATVLRRTRDDSSSESVVHYLAAYEFVDARRLVPKPRAHLTRYHGVFAPASPDRARVVPKTRAGARPSDGISKPAEHRNRLASESVQDLVVEGDIQKRGYEHGSDIEGQSHDQ